MQSLKDILEKAEQADVITWYRGDFTHCRGHLVLFVDNIPANLREVHDIRLTSSGVYYELATLTDYDAKAKRWNTYVNPREVSRPIKRAGEKALRKLLSDLAFKVSGYHNPEAFSYYKLAS